MAAGVDAAAHRASLKEQGWTIGVLGHGFEFQYPRENKNLFEQMAVEGTLITEFPYDFPPRSEHFPQRNRIISGLSKGVVVVEAAEKSGALITARYAAEQGKDVFAVPGSLFQTQSKGSNRLIKEGAKLVESAEDVLDEYGVLRPRVQTSAVSPEALSAEESDLLKQVQNAPLSIDELVELNGKPVDRLAELLLSLELKGRISSMPGQRYVARY
jgi:DNA processing protein